MSTPEAVSGTNPRPVSPVLRPGARWSIALVMGSALMYLLLGLISLMILVRSGGRGVPPAALVGYQIGSVFQFGLFIAGGVVFLVWLFRANRRLRAIGREGMQYTPGWSVGWFFIPLANFVVPTAVVQELWRASAPDPSPTGWKSSPRSGLVNAWWSLFIIGNLISRIGAAITVAGEQTGAFVGDALSSVLLVVAAACLVILIRRIESRVTALESAVPAEGTAAYPAPATQPRLLHAIPGAAVGMVVGAGWMTLFYQLLMFVGVRSGAQIPVTLFTALILGMLVGYWTLLAAGGRRPHFAPVAGIAAFLSVFAGTLFANAAMLARAFNVEMILNWFTGMFTNPLLYIAAALAVGAAVAVTLIKLPIDLWRAPVHGATPVTEWAAAVPAVAPPAVAEQPVVYAEPMPAEVPTAPPPYAAPSPQVPAPPPQAPQPQAPPPQAPQPREPFNLREFVSRNRVAVIIVGIVVVLLACSCCGVSAVLIARGIMEDEGAAPADVTPAPVVPEAEEVVVPEEIEPIEPAAGWMPEDTIIGLYTMAAAGDRESAQSMWANPSDLDPDVLASWGDPDWAIDDVTAGEANGEMLVQVWETDGGFSDGDTVTYVLREFDGAWLITGWALGTIEEYREWSRSE